MIIQYFHPSSLCPVIFVNLNIETFLYFYILCKFNYQNEDINCVIVELPHWPCALMMTDTGSLSMNVIHFRWRQTALFIGAIVILVLYNEWLVYYFVLLQCQWPTLSIETNDFTVNDEDGTANSVLHVMVLADTHLLGIREGHWFDKLRRLVIMLYL